jgi:Zn-dependent protease
MDAVIDGLISYICLVIVITFHEFAHAWTASKCGDDTARLLGRVSLNPVVHMEVIGTVVLPLLAIFLSMANSAVASFIIGWGRPVPVNPYNLRKPRVHDVYVALAGPGMNIVLALVAMILARGFEVAGLDSMVPVAARLALISLLLCFFNLIPVPPLDGSHVLRHFVGMKDETYMRLSQYGFLIVIVLIQFDAVRQLLGLATYGTFFGMKLAVGLNWPPVS